jgi:small subunit ribosomal protein S6
MQVKQYETIFILTPVLSEAQVAEVAEKFKQVLKENGADLLHEESMGLRQLAYPIQKKGTGHYFLLEYTVGATNAVDVLELAFRRDERILRFLTVALDKHAIVYNERRRKGEFNKVAAPAGEVAEA